MTEDSAASDRPAPPAREPEAERSRRRLAPEERRADLLGAAFEVFTEVGFGRATLQDVADLAGVTKGALYHYFDSKEQLFVELVRERLLPQMLADEAAMEGLTGSREEVLRQLIERMWAHFQRPGQLEVTRLILTELPKFPELGRTLFDEVTERGRQTIRRALDRGVARGELCPATTDAVVNVIPYMVMGVALGQHVFRGIDPAELDPDCLRQVVTAVLLCGVSRTCAPGGVPAPPPTP